MTVALDADHDAVWNRFKREHRKDVRRAWKNGSVARFGADLLDDLDTVLAEGWRDLGTPIYHKSYFEEVLRFFGDAISIAMVCDDNGTPAAGAFSGFHGGVAEGLWLGTRQSYRRQMVGYVLNITNPKYRLAIRAWRQLPVPVTNLVGPWLARSIP